MTESKHGFPFEITENLKFINEQNNLTPKVIFILDSLYLKSENATLNLVEIIALCKEYPDVPKLKDILHQIYIQKGKIEMASELGKIILQEHPQYVLFRTRMANYYLYKNESEMVPLLLGEDLELHLLYPARKLFHIQEVVYFYTAVSNYYIAMARNDEALGYFIKITRACFPNKFTHEQQLKIAHRLIEDYSRKLGNKTQK